MFGVVHCYEVAKARGAARAHAATEDEGAMNTQLVGRAASPVRAVVIDDDVLTREGARRVFTMHPAIGRYEDHTLEDALGLDAQHWRQFDVIVVDIHDETKQAYEKGTDVYTGVALIELIRSHGIRSRILAITPSRNDPLLWERLTRSGADYVHQRIDFQAPADLVQAVLQPNETCRPVSYPRWVLIQEGLGQGANPNRAVAIFKNSPLYGLVDRDITLEATGTRREVRRLRDQIIDTGFVGSGQSPRWNEVRDYLLKLTGRLHVEPRPHPNLPSGPHQP